MIPRYFTRRAKLITGKSRNYYDDDPSLFLPTLTVSDHEAADTGLIDVNGESIMRAPNPMGFVWDEIQ